MRFALLVVLVPALLFSAPARSDPTPPAGCTVAADCQFVQQAVPACRKRAAASPVLANDAAACRCDFPTGRCVFAWEGPVACSSNSDCAWGRDERSEVALPTRLTPHPSKKAKRSHACADQVVASCSPQARICVLRIPKC